MNKVLRQTDIEIIRRYTDQPVRLPASLRARIESAWNGAPVELYALADLGPSMQLTTSWLCLGPLQLVVATENTDVDGCGYELCFIDRNAIGAVRERQGLSCNVLSLLGAPGTPALAEIRYTHRQRLPLENIRFVLEEAIEDRAVPVGNADEQYIDGIAKPIREAQALVARREIGVLFRLLGYLGPYRRQVIVGMTAAAFITLLSLAPPLIAGRLIDDVVGPVQAGELALADASRIAWLAVAAMALVHLLRQLCAWVRLRVMSVLGELVARDLRTELYEHLQKLSLAFFSRKKTGSLITRVCADTDRLWEFLALGIIDVSLSLLLLIGLGGVLIWLDWSLGLVMILPVPLLCAAIWLHGERLQGLFLHAWRKWSNVTDVVSDTIPGMRVVKAFNQEGREKQRFDSRNHDATTVFNRIHVSWTLFWPGLMLSIHAITVLVWVFAVPRLLATGEDGIAPLSAGTFVAFLLYMTMFIAPIEIIGQMSRIANRATSSAHRVFEVLDSEPEVVDRPEPAKVEVQGQVRFDNVSFGYDGVRQVIRGVSFEIEPGEMIGLVGPSGGGKTTLINLIARFFDVTGGSITIDGVDLRDLDSGYYREQLGMVLQDPYLFHGTVAENIRYGLPDASEAQIVEAAKAANAHDFVCRLDHGYDTLVGERGHTLSGGERQRISIARAILRDPKLLILDEATSSVDTETERKIQEALNRLTAGRTVIAIAHRLSTLHRADRILVVKDGRILEQGTHAALLADGESLYKRLYELQRDLAHGIPTNSKEQDHGPTDNSR
jgi:ATP-binding cassette subfamily B protein